MGTAIVRGRGFTEGDRFGAPRVVVVNETMARVLWPGQNAIGRCVRVNATSDTIPCSEVVGIARDARWNEIRPEPAMQYYVPLAQRQWSGSIRDLLVRPSGDPRAVAEAVEREVLAEATRLDFARVRPLQENLDPVVHPWRLGASMFSAFGALALVLAAVGLYGVLAYTVAQRTQEMGIRLALGARTAEGLHVAAVGVGIGVAAALAAGRWVEGLLYEVSAHDPLVIGSIVGMLLLVAAAASLVPAWRATRVDPSVALRAE
jgi:hypothetical protein